MEMALQAQEIRARRYFYPALHLLQAFSATRHAPLPNAEKLAEQVLCLPLYPSLAIEDADRISNIIRGTIK